MSNNCILVIDDDYTALKYTSECLEHAGYDCSLAKDGQEGLEIFEKENPGLVTLSTVMYKIDGFEVCRRLREVSEVPIIMLSTRNDENERVKCLDLGADDYIAKPFAEEELVAHVKVLFRRTETLGQDTHDNRSGYITGVKEFINNDEINTRDTSPPGKRELLGEILVRLGLAAEDQIYDALQVGKKENKLLGQVLVEKGIVTAYDLAKALSIQLNVSLIDLTKYKIDKEVIKLVPEKLARKHNVLPLNTIGNSLMLVMENIADIRAIDEISFVTRRRIEPMLGIPDEIRRAINRSYSFVSQETELEQLTVVEFTEVEEKTDSMPERTPIDPITEEEIVQAPELIRTESIVEEEMAPEKELVLTESVTDEGTTLKSEVITTESITIDDKTVRAPESTLAESMIDGEVALDLEPVMTDLSVEGDITSVSGMPVEPIIEEETVRAPESTLHESTKDEKIIPVFDPTLTEFSVEEELATATGLILVEPIDEEEITEISELTIAESSEEGKMALESELILTESVMEEDTTPGTEIELFGVPTNQVLDSVSPREAEAADTEDSKSVHKARVGEESAQDIAAETKYTGLPDRKELLGEILVRLGLATAEQVDDALQTGKKENKLLGQVLVEKSIVKAYDLAKALSIQLNVSLIDLSKYKIDKEAIKLVPEKLARKHNVFPINVIGNSLMLVMENVRDIRAIEEISFVTRKRIEPMIGLPDDIRKAIDRNYSLDLQEAELQEITVIESRMEEEESLNTDNELSDAPAKRVLNKILKQAAQRKVSDIHIEPQKNRTMIRFRIDGVLQDKESVPRALHSSILSRLKIVSGMNIAETRRPQDGRFSFNVNGQDFDVRVACGNTINGEMAVLRLLSKLGSLAELSGLGLMPDMLKKYENLLMLPFGMILLGGPTGSGKTTTLYASINILNRIDRNILTIEDPVEYDCDVINQFQVNVKAGVTFATGLRSFMRLDPDIIMVGEIRDSETARIASQAALTGHLVLSSIHANDAVGVTYRILDLGVEPYMLCATLAGSVSQRLVRRICPSCREIYTPSVEEKAAYKLQMDELPYELYHGKGCNICEGTGYLGRIGVYEILELTDNIKELVLSGSPASKIREKALEEGMTCLMKDGMMKVKDGLTTISEIMRNVYF